MKGTSCQTCEFCDGALEQRIVRARFHCRGQTIYIDHVPAWVCARCGEQEFDGPVYERMEAIAQAPGRIANMIEFPLAEYDTGGPPPAGAAGETHLTGPADLRLLDTYCSLTPGVHPNAYDPPGQEANESALRDFARESLPSSTA